MKEWSFGRIWSGNILCAWVNTQIGQGVNHKDGITDIFNMICIYFGPEILILAIGILSVPSIAKYNQIVACADAWDQEREPRLWCQWTAHSFASGLRL